MIKKIKNIHNTQEKRGSLIITLMITIVSVMFISVAANEAFLKTERPFYIISDNNYNELNHLQKLNRAIASAEPMSLVQDISWEHQVASRLLETKDFSSFRNPAAVSNSVSELNKFRFGILKGKYFLVQEENGKIREMDYISSDDSSDEPVLVQDLSRFLMEHRHLFSVNYNKVKASEKKMIKASASLNKKEQAGGAEQVEVYELLNEANKIIGKATIKLGTNNQLFEISFDTEEQKE